MDRPLLPLGLTTHPERADAARNRRHLLTTAREMLEEYGRDGIDRLTMDGLAERAGLGKGTVFRRFGTRAGIFEALLDDAETAFQQKTISGPPPLGPGAEPLERLIAYGRARVGFLMEHGDIARAALGSSRPAVRTSISLMHIRMLLGLLDLGDADLEILAIQLTGALDGTLLLYLAEPDLSEGARTSAARMGPGWEDLVRRVCR